MPFRSVNAWVQKHSAALSAWSSALTIVASIIAVIGFTTLLIGGILGFLQLKSSLQKPDVALAVVNSNDPAFVIHNPSPVVARDVVLTMGLWDLDARAEAPAPRYATDPDYDPGNLSAKGMDVSYVLPGAGSGPHNMTNFTRAYYAVPSGHTIFGPAFLRCSECGPKAYWVMIEKNGTAWFVEMSVEEQASVYQNLRKVLNARAGFAGVITEIIPVKRRVRAADPP